MRGLNKSLFHRPGVRRVASLGRTREYEAPEISSFQPREQFLANQEAQRDRADVENNLNFPNWRKFGGHPSCFYGKCEPLCDECKVHRMGARHIVRPETPVPEVIDLTYPSDIDDDDRAIFSGEEQAFINNYMS